MNIRIFFITLSLIFSLGLKADNVNFLLNPNGTFLTEDGKSYVIVQFEGKTAQELYDMVKANVLTLYDSPQDVLNEVPKTNITIRAMSGVLHRSYKMLSAFTEYRAMYTLVFQFKDGKIKVEAPDIDSNLKVTASAVPMPKTFKNLVDDWFDKKGKVKKGKQQKVSKIEYEFNYPINYLLGNYKDIKERENEDW